MKLAPIALIGLLVGPALSVNAEESGWLQSYWRREDRLKRVFQKSMPDLVIACVNAGTRFVLSSGGLDVDCGNGRVRGASHDELRWEGFAIIEGPKKSQNPLEMGSYELVDSAFFDAAADLEPEGRVAMAKIHVSNLLKALLSLKGDIEAARRRAEAAAEAERIGRALAPSGSGSDAPESAPWPNKGL